MTTTRTVAFMPTLTDYDKSEVKDWIRRALDGTELMIVGTPFPAAGRLILYWQGAPRIISNNSHWQESDPYLYIGYRTGGETIPKLDRMAILGGIITLCGLWDDLHEQFTTKLAELMFSQYRSAVSGMVRSESPISGLAFNSDRTQMAARIGEEYHLSSGEPVELTEDWVAIEGNPSLIPLPEAEAVA